MCERHDCIHFTCPSCDAALHEKGPGRHVFRAGAGLVVQAASRAYDASMADKFHQFVWVWFPVASYHARGQIADDATAKRFLSNAWDAFTAGTQSAADFGKS